MEFDDYESLPTEHMGIHMTAGAVAGILEHCIMYPIDSVKTRMQSLNPSPEATYRTVREGLTKMVANEGALRTVRGASAMVVGAGPAHAMYFASYEFIKKRFRSKNPYQTHLTNAAAGCCATLLHDAIMVPSEVIKQRMQMYNSPYSSCLDCLCKLYCKEGMRALYRSYSTQVLMNIPFHAFHIMIYEKCSQSFNPSGDYNPLVHMTSGACAGAFASAVTTPLDVCKTVLNTQETSTLVALNQTRVIGVLGAAKTVYAMRGFRGYFMGLQARILYQVPGTAISWSVYELFKHQLKSRRLGSDSGPDDEDETKDYETHPDLQVDKKHNSSSKFYSMGSLNNPVLRDITVPAHIAACSSVQDQDQNFFIK